jgi:osmotically-inducible protein OsmY
MKALYSISILSAALALFALNVPANASTTMDNRIESSAKQSYVFKTYLQDDDIKIQSRNGAVTLTGIVSENFHKSLALETVTGLPGVKNVDNRLEVKGAPPTANSDAWLRDKVKVALLFHRSVSAAKTEVDVKEGVVTLRGEASSQSQKELTAEYARDVEGIKDVKNEMTVSQTPKKAHRTIGEKVDDASITAQVNMSLLNHRSTSVLNTTVKTKRGVVTVGGKAKIRPKRIWSPSLSPILTVSGA